MYSCLTNGFVPCNYGTNFTEMENSLLITHGMSEKLLTEQ